MKLRVGIDGRRSSLLNKAKELGAPILVSANSLWNYRKGTFSTYKKYEGHDMALDSGGFVAMKRYGGYRWTIDQYCDLARALAPTWWAQMDFCCEPEVAQDRGEVFKRIDHTVEHLMTCQAVAGAMGIKQPMPVLQGWHPEDYCSGPIYDPGYAWPELVGIGSVCRRQLRGPDGILAVMAALDAKVPAGVKFHLFGVKGPAITKVNQEYPNRLESTDSMAWRMGHRWAIHHGTALADEQSKAEFMGQWYRRQMADLEAAEQQAVLKL